MPRLLTSRPVPVLTNHPLLPHLSTNSTEDSRVTGDNPSVTQSSIAVGQAGLPCRHLEAQTGFRSCRLPHKELHLYSEM